MIVLSHSARGPGGAQSIVIRVSEELAARGISCAVLDIPCGFVWNRLQQSSNHNPRLINVEGQQNLDGLLSAQDTVVAFNEQVLVYASSFRRDNPRLLIWDISGYEVWDEFLRGGKPQWIFESATVRRWRDRLVRDIAMDHGVAFVNELCRSSFQAIAPSAAAGTIVPVPVPLLHTPRIRAVPPDRAIRAVYIGRASPWKVAPAKRIIRDFLRDGQTRLTIVTDAAGQFREILGYDSKDVDYREALTEQQLEAFLLAEADLCFGMGTACLEGARLGIPSILCDFTHGGAEFPQDYGYRWLFEESGFGLGRALEGSAPVPGISGDAIIAQLRSSGGELGRSCWTAVRDKFEVSHVVDQLLKAIQETHLTIDRFRRNPAFSLLDMKRRFTKWLRGTPEPDMPLRDPS